MTINQNTAYILEHPFTKKAVKEFLSGKEKDLRFLIEIIQVDIYQEVAMCCARAFRANKKENYPDVEAAIRDVAPPTRLSCRLPIPLPDPICKVVKMKPKLVRCVNPHQLCFDFKQAGPQSLVALQG